MGAGQILAENVIIIKMMRGREIGIVVETESEIMIMIIMIGLDGYRKKKLLMECL